MFLYFYGPTVRVLEYPERFFRQLLIAARSFYITVHLKFKICKLPYTLHKLLEKQKIFFTPEKKKKNINQVAARSDMERSCCEISRNF